MLGDWRLTPATAHAPDYVKFRLVCSGATTNDKLHVHCIAIHGGVVQDDAKILPLICLNDYAAPIPSQFWINDGGDLFMIRRCEFIAGLGGTAAWPVAAQRRPAMPVIGYIGNRERGGSNSDFLKGLSETAYADGRNVTIEYRWTEGHEDWAPAIVNDLISRRVAVGGSRPVTAGREADREGARP
jgi:hypothetical protein